MAYIKKNVNGALLFLLIVLIVAFIGFTYYFRHRFTNLTEDYYAKKANIDTLQDELKAQQSKLSETAGTLAEKKEKEEQLSGKFKDIVDQKNSIQQDLDSTKDDLSVTKDSLGKAQRDLTQARVQLNTAVSSLNSCSRDLSSAEDSLSGCRSQLSSCQASLPH